MQSSSDLETQGNASLKEINLNKNSKKYITWDYSVAKLNLKPAACVPDYKVIYKHKLAYMLTNSSLLLSEKANFRDTLDV